MSPADQARAAGALPAQSEASFQKAVVELAKVLKWRVYHTWLSVRSEGGWPDLFMVRDRRAVAAELKSARGKVTPAQEMWLEYLSEAGIETHVWRPADWDDVMRVLR